MFTFNLPLMADTVRHKAWLVGAAAALCLTLAQAAVVVKVAPVQASLVGNAIEFEGVLQAVKQSTLSAQASGRVATLRVKAGERVRAGQLLATIDDREAQTGMQHSQAQVAQAQAELYHAQASFNRTRDLQRQGFVSAAALDSAQAQFKSAQAGREQANASTKQSSLTLGFTKVTAPFDAWVLQTLVEPGDLALPGKPLLTLYAPLPMRAVVQVPVSRAKLLSGDAKATVQLPGLDGNTNWVVPLQSSHLPSADAVAQTIEWRLLLPDQAVGAVLPGQQVRVRFSAGQSQRLLIPSAAVLRRGELTAVYVAAGNAFSLRAVRLGADHGVQGTEVLAGLSAAELVALDPVKAGLAGAQPSAQAAPTK